MDKKIEVTQNGSQFLDQIEEDCVEVMDINALKEKLNSIPNPFQDPSVAGSAHEKGEPSGTKKGIKLPLRLLLLPLLIPTFSKPRVGQKLI